MIRVSVCSARPAGGSGRRGLLRCGRRRARLHARASPTRPAPAPARLRALRAAQAGSAGCCGVAGIGLAHGLGRVPHGRRWPARARAGWPRPGVQAAEVWPSPGSPLLCYSRRSPHAHAHGVRGKAGCREAPGPRGADCAGRAVRCARCSRCAPACLPRVWASAAVEGWVNRGCLCWRSCRRLACPPACAAMCKRHAKCAGRCFKSGQCCERGMRACAAQDAPRRRRPRRGQRDAGHPAHARAAHDGRAQHQDAGDDAAAAAGRRARGRRGARRPPAPPAPGRGARRLLAKSTLPYPTLAERGLTRGSHQGACKRSAGVRCPPGRQPSTALCGSGFDQGRTGAWPGRVPPPGWAGPRRGSARAR